MKRHELQFSHILVVDDDEVACHLLREILAEEGYEVEMVRSGQEAVKKGETAFYDLVITDLKIPDLDGLEVLKCYKQMSPETLVIMITAFGSIESAIEAMNAGAFDYISKPFRESEIKLMTLDELERRYFIRVIKVTGGNKSEAARILGIDRRTLYRMAERYHITL